MAGTSFGRYRLVRLLARGGMAEVYLAVLTGQAGFEKRLALKRILPIYGDLDEFTELFVDEARISVSLDHGNIVQTFDFGLHEGEPFLAMEYVDGPDLEKVLAAVRKLKRPLGHDAVLYVGTRVAAALDYAHSRVDESGRPMAIIHRDVSPPNVLLSVSGDVKLTDFGVARYAMSLSRSRPGVVRGKYAYMSPEQLLGNEIDSRSDVFSLGTLLYEMATGQNPFLGATDYQTMERVVAASPAPIQSRRPGMPEDLAQVITRCLHPTPGGRYATAGEVRRDLAAVQFRRGVLDDPASIVEELWALFPRQLARRGVPLKTRPKVDVKTPSIGAPRMRGPAPSDSPRVRPGKPRVAEKSVAPPKPPNQAYEEDDLTIPHLVSNPDAVPTQPLDGHSGTLDAPQQVPASLAPLGSGAVSDPFGTLMPRRPQSNPVQVDVAGVSPVRSTSRLPESIGPTDPTDDPARETVEWPVDDPARETVEWPVVSEVAADGLEDREDLPGVPDPFASIVAGADALSRSEPRFSPSDSITVESPVVPETEGDDDLVGVTKSPEDSGPPPVLDASPESDSVLPEFDPPPENSYGIGVLGRLAIAATLALLVFLVAQNVRDVGDEPTSDSPTAPAMAVGVPETTSASNSEPRRDASEKATAGPDRSSTSSEADPRVPPSERPPNPGSEPTPSPRSPPPPNQKPFPDEATVGVVKVTSDPWAYLAVDGRVLGNVSGADPFEVELTSGEHVLSVDNPMVEWSERRIVVVEAGQTIDVRFEKQ